VVYGTNSTALERDIGGHGLEEMDSVRTMALIAIFRWRGGEGFENRIQRRGYLLLHDEL
jgi:hypothetical protein